MQQEDPRKVWIESQNQNLNLNLAKNLEISLLPQKFGQKQLFYNEIWLDYES